MSDTRIAVLFVCLGNICRSPLAACVFRDLAIARGVIHRLHIESCGTGDWHVGADADPRSRAVALRHGHAMQHRARQLNPANDASSFNFIIAMDRKNRRDIAASIPLADAAVRIELFRRFDPLLRDSPDDRLDIPDPYSGGDDGFETVYQMIVSASEGLLDDLFGARSR